MGEGRTEVAAHRLGRTLSAGLLTAVTDGLFASGLSVFAYGSSVSRLFQGVASVVIGPYALTGGWRTTLLGLVMHVGVACGWSAVFVFVLLRFRRIRQLVSSQYGLAKVACLYGPTIWLIMSLVVIPAFVRRPPTIGVRWVVQLIGHSIFVGLPIVAIGRGARDESR